MAYNVARTVLGLEVKDLQERLFETDSFSNSTSDHKFQTYFSPNDLLGCKSFSTFSFAVLWNPSPIRFDLLLKSWRNYRRPGGNKDIRFVCLFV